MPVVETFASKQLKKVQQQKAKRSVSGPAKLKSAPTPPNDTKDTPSSHTAAEKEVNGSKDVVASDSASQNEPVGFPAFVEPDDASTSSASTPVTTPSPKERSDPMKKSTKVYYASNGQEHVLDRFAPIFIQKWLLDVNHDIQFQFIPRSPVEAGHINFETLIDQLFPRGLVHMLLNREAQDRKQLNDKTLNVRPYFPPRKTTILPSPALQPPHVTLRTVSAAIPIQKPRSKGPPPPIIPLGMGANPASLPVQIANADASIPFELAMISKIPELTPATYGQYWIPLQELEFHARTVQLDGANLYAVDLLPVRRDGLVLYILKARSIREGWPPVDLGDAVHLRQLLEHQHNWQKLLFEATVYSINRGAGEVVLRCDALANRHAGLVFNVGWIPPGRVLHHWRLSTDTIATAINWRKSVEGQESKRSAAETWLFPEFEDAHQISIPNTVGLEARGAKWVNASLNKEQKHAVESILWGDHRTPYLINGPPGTGKTSTLVEAILQLLKQNTSSVLVCGASNPSADTLALRLSEHLKPNELFRLNSSSRPFAEVRNQLLPFCHIEGTTFGIPPLSLLLGKSVIVTTCIDATILSQVRCTNHDLTSLEFFTTSSIHPHAPANRPRPHFGALLVDEAGQATEPDVCCALAVVVSSDERSAHRPMIVLCGDAFQLGPQIVSPACRSMDLDISLLERLSMRPVYSQHVFARKHRKALPAGADLSLGTGFTNLVKNYRSAAPILMLPSTLFYHETLDPLAPESTQKSILHKWRGLPRENFPIVFHGVDGQDEPADEGASYKNDIEVEKVATICRDLIAECNTLEKGGLRPSEISVISPFREQVWQIRTQLRKVGLGEVDVGNTEALQGAENRVVIISTVRTTARWLELDRHHNRGLIYEPKRWNVAMTRAKEVLIVIGDPKILTRDTYWKAFYRFCIRNKCYEGVELSDTSLTANANYISRLEQHYWQNLQRGSNGADDSAAEDDAHFDMLVGSLARQTLDDDDEE